jgi:hypothetical protein
MSEETWILVCTVPVALVLASVFVAVCVWFGRRDVRKQSAEWVAAGNVERRKGARRRSDRATWGRP